MRTLDFTKMTYHALIERKTRFELIENTIGFGKPLCETKDKSGERNIILTDTGVMAVIANDNTIITAWIANFNQAIAIYKTATGANSLPEILWKYINYNNNTKAWHRMATA